MCWLVVVLNGCCSCNKWCSSSLCGLVVGVWLYLVGSDVRNGAVCVGLVMGVWVVDVFVVVVWCDWYCGGSFVW